MSYGRLQTVSIMIARNFLGWNRPMLDAVCDWLLAEVPQAPDFSACVIVVPGGRAGRRLLQLLAARCDEKGMLLVPPQIVPVGKSLRMLFDEPPGLCQPASGFVQSLAWSLAIGELPEADARLLGCPPEQANRDRQARPLAAVCAELGAHLLKPDDVLPLLERSETATERTIHRWRTVQSAQDHYLGILAKWRTSDPTEFQIKLALKGRPKPGIQTILAGLAEFPPMIEKAFERLDPPPGSLVFAPENEADRFDRWGRIVPDKWKNCAAPLTHGEVRCVENTIQQAESIATLACEWTTPESRSALVIAAPDEDDIPQLRDALAEKGITARPSAVKKFRTTRPWQVLSLLADYLDRPADQPPEFSAVAQLARHSDLTGILQADAKLLSALDDWQGDHLPEAFAPANAGYEEQSDRRELLIEFAGRLEEFILLRPHNLPARDLAKSVSAFLESVFGGLTAQRDSPEGRALIRPLTALLDELQSAVAAAPDQPYTPSDFIRALLESRGNDPVPATFLRDAVDIVGWLELAADDSPAAAVTSLCEGIVPQSITSDPLLPGRLRELLLLNHDSARLGRDAYLLTAIARSRPGRLAVFVPRKNADGDPLRPGRLLLAGLEGDALATRLVHLTTHHTPAVPQAGATTGARLAAEIPAPGTRIEKVNVSAFRDYLASPRLFYFKHVLRLQTADDHSDEIDNALQGTMIHAVCAAFGNWKIKESTNESEIRKWVLERLEQEAAGRFAGIEPPIVKFQIESLRSRLMAFARIQAQERRAGWKIVYAENPGDNSQKLDGLLGTGESALKIRGRIDRIDFNEQTNLWRVIDYKTSSKAGPPDKQHFSKPKTGDVRWKDLQLPLYDLLIPGLAPRLPGFRETDKPQLCYFMLPDDPGTAAVSEPFDPEMIAPGIEKAKEIAAQIRAGDFMEPGTVRPDEDPVLRALCGLTGWTDENEQDEEEETP